MPGDPQGPRGSVPPDSEQEPVPSPRRRVGALRIPEDHVARPMTPPITARTILLDDPPSSVKTPSMPSVRLGTSPDEAEAAARDQGLEDFLLEPIPVSTRARLPTLVDPFEATAGATMTSPRPPKAVPVANAPHIPVVPPVAVVPTSPLRVPPIDAPSVLDLDEVGGELDDTPPQPAAAVVPAAPLTPTPVTPVQAVPPVHLAPPPGAGAGAAPATVRTPPAGAHANGRGRSRLGVDSMPPQARPWWEAIFQDDYPRFSTPRTAGQVASDVAFIEARLNLAAGARILDVACGDGSHAAALASCGFDVVGIDTSLPLLARASANAQSSHQRVQFQQLDMRDLTEASAYDGAVVWDNGYGYFDEAMNERVLANLHRALRPRGQLLVDMLNRDYVVSRLPSLVWFEGQRCICMDDAHLDVHTSRLVVHRTVLFEEGRSREYDYSMRLFSAHELRAMFERVGFRVVEVSGHVATPGAFFGAESPRLIVLAERPLTD